MPPKRKVVRTVRKTKPKTPTPPPAATEPEAAAAPEPTPTEPSAQEPAATSVQEPATSAQEPATSAQEPATSSQEPVATSAQEPVAAAPDETSVPADTAPLDSSPKPSETAAPEIPAVEEPAAVYETPPNVPEIPDAETPAANEEPTAAPDTSPAPSETKPPAKTVTRVRKVIKKKIVKKIVPKASVAAKGDDKVGQEEAAAPPAPLPEKSPNEEAGTENPSSGGAPEEAPETEKVESGNGEDAPMEVEKGDDVEQRDAAAEGEEGMSERRMRRKTEIFIGGLDRDAKEEDIREVFEKIGEIVEIRMMMDGQTGKNKGYAFLRYAEASQAKKAVSEFTKVEVCGKLCGTSAVEGNDTIFLGNIDKKWKKEDIIKLLQEIGIEKIDTVTVVADPNNSDSNRGFAFLELQTNRDAHLAYKKLQKKDVFGKGLNIKVAWAEPLNDPDEEEMKKVKSVYAEGIPSSWDEGKVRGYFKKFGEIERVVLARNIKTARRKDFAFVNYTTREAALSCIESFDKEELTENGSKVNVKVSLAKPVQKGKQNKGAKHSNKDNNKEKPKTIQRDTKVNISSNKGKSFKQGHATSDKKSSTTNEPLHVLRDQATWKQGQISYARGTTVQDYTQSIQGGKRTFSALGDDALYSDLRGYPRARLDSSFPVAGSSYGTLPHGMVGSSMPYYQHQYQHQGVGYGTGARYGAADYTSTHQMRQGAPPYGRNFYSRY